MTTNDGSTMDNKFNHGDTAHIEFNHRETASDGSELIANVYKGVFLPSHSGTIDRVKDLRTMDLRDDDVIICTYPKSGSNWVSNIVELMLHKEELATGGWKSHPRQFFLESVDRDKYVNAASPRVMFTHLLPDFLPREQMKAGKTRLIGVMRNPKDIIVSYYYFLSELGVYKGSLEGLVELFLKGKCHYGDWFDHVQEYKRFAEENQKNFLHLKFEDIKKDSSGEVRRVAEYLGVSVTDAEIATILDLSSVAKMREKHENEGGMLRRIGQLMYRKGNVGGWKDEFTVAMSEKFDAEYERRGIDIKQLFSADVV